MLTRTLSSALLLLAVSLPVVAEEGTVNYQTMSTAHPDTKALLQKVVTGFGGEGQLRTLKSIRKVAQIDETNTKGVRLQSSFEGVAVFPNSLYARIDLPEGSLTAVSTPDMAYVFPANAKIENAALRLNDTEKQVLIRYFYEEPILLLRNRIDPNYLFASGGKVKVNGVETELLYIHAAGMDMQWYIDASGRVVRTKLGDKVTDFTDWRLVNGLSVPFTERSESNGRVELVRYREYQFNPQVDMAAIFVKPTLWMTRNSLPALGRRNRASSSGFGDYVNAYVDDYGSYSDYDDYGSFDDYLLGLYSDNY